MVEQQPFKLLAAGSSPARFTTFSNKINKRMSDSYANFFELTGKVIIGIDAECDRIVTADGYLFTLKHVQDCCESVVHMKTIGDPQSLIGNTINIAQEDVCDDPDWAENNYSDESHTWTVFTLVDDKGNRVDAYWLGESNGYYHESVSVFKDKIS